MLRRAAAAAAITLCDRARLSAEVEVARPHPGVFVEGPGDFEQAAGSKECVVPGRHQWAGLKGCRQGCGECAVKRVLPSNKTPQTGGMKEPGLSRHFPKILGRSSADSLFPLHITYCIPLYFCLNNPFSGFVSSRKPPQTEFFTFQTPNEVFRNRKSWSTRSLNWL
jgi:hypothetical protein